MNNPFKYLINNVKNITDNWQINKINYNNYFREYYAVFQTENSIFKNNIFNDNFFKRDTHSINC